ncbi:MAG: hypothetical protein IJP75_02990 [Bacteroidaceae bacterium]|nr:hypothetical protein [Bacteroidaceae bacterium]
MKRKDYRKPTMVSLPPTNWTSTISSMYRRRQDSSRTIMRSKGGYCFPRQELLARKTGVTPPTKTIPSIASKLFLSAPQKTPFQHLTTGVTHTDRTGVTQTGTHGVTHTAFEAL